MSGLADTPSPPYYAVIFTSTLTGDLEGYAQTADRMLELAKTQDGYLGVEAARDGVGITVSYWRDLEAIKAWKTNIEHVAAQQKGAQQWYADYTTRIAKVEREYSKK